MVRIVVCALLLACVAATPSVHAAAAPVAEKSAINTADLFGFSDGSDMDDAGGMSAGSETAVRLGRRGGGYTGIDEKLTFSYAPTDSIGLQPALLGGWRVASAVQGVGSTNAARFDGASFQIRWRLLARDEAAVGVLLETEPYLRVTDFVAGVAGQGFGTETRLVLDRALIEDRLFGTINLIWDIDNFRPRGGPWGRSGTGGVSAALAWQVAGGFFLGGEVRYLRQFASATFGRMTGEAFYAGPTLHWEASEAVAISLVATVQVAGRARGNRAALDLADFERQQVKLKATVSF